MARTHLIPVRVSPEEKALIRNAADAAQRGVSDFLRVLALREANAMRTGEPIPALAPTPRARQVVASARAIRESSTAPAGGGDGLPGRPFVCPLSRYPDDPSGGCSFGADVPGATCPSHGRKVVPA